MKHYKCSHKQVKNRLKQINIEGLSYFYRGGRRVVWICKDGIQVAGFLAYEFRTEPLEDVVAYIQKCIEINMK